MRIPTIAIAGSAILAAVAGLVIGSGALAPQQAAPSPTPTAAPSPTATRPNAKAYVVAPGKTPLLVETQYPLVTGTLLTRVASRIDGLRSAVTPEGYSNPYATSTVRLERLTNDEPSVISLWFRVPGNDWGVPADQARLFLQQLVWTVTEEPGIELVRIWQNEGREGGASVAGEPANYEMRRKDFP